MIVYVCMQECYKYYASLIKQILNNSPNSEESNNYLT
jgi:hypothetical protein